MLLTTWMRHQRPDQSTQMSAGDRISEVPRWLQIASGLFIGLLAVLCLFASLSLVFPPPAKRPMLSIIAGVLAGLGCIWVAVKAVRLILGRPLTGGLLSPLALRVVSIVVLCLPIAGLFTGYFAKRPLLATLQTLVYVGLSFYLWRLATFRSAQTRLK